ncbi:MAG TPA: hypothetical protein VHY77_10410, partial [Acidimicrobiales bacterium]|nr:hypothetical protein [Acidimicrobiales bacterium]
MAVEAPVGHSVAGGIVGAGRSVAGGVVRAWRRALAPVRRWSPEWRDAALYGISGLFALVTATLAGIPLYRQWGLMAFGPYLAG